MYLYIKYITYIIYIYIYIVYVYKIIVSYFLGCGWNRYLTFALTSFVELPSNYVAIFALDRYATNFVIHIHAAID